MKWSDLTTFDRALSLARSGDLMMIRKNKEENSFFARLLPTARRFNITDNAALRIRDTMANYPEYLSENSQFAIPPFKTMWVEYNSRLMLDHELLTGQMTEEADERVAYLFHNGRVYTFSESKELMPGRTAFEFVLNKPMTIENQRTMANLFDVSRIGIDPFLWGHNMHKHLDTPTQRGLRDQHDVQISKSVESLLSEYPDEVKRILRYGYNGSSGELRNILGILLMMNQPSKSLQIGEVPRKRGLVRGKSMPYFGYSNVDINLDKSVHFNPKRKPNAGERASLRWHEVRGHFCHNQKTKEIKHEHVWRETDPRKWECALECGARRWWREYPEGKGSAEKGFIHQSRRVKTKQDQKCH